MVHCLIKLCCKTICIFTSDRKKKRKSTSAQTKDNSTRHTPKRMRKNSSDNGQAGKAGEEVEVIVIDSDSPPDSSPDSSPLKKVRIIF